MHESAPSRKTNLFVILGAIFLTNAILAEIIGVKIFSGERSLGFEPVQWTFFGVRKISFLTAGLITYVFVVISLVTALAPADFWMQVNASMPDGSAFDINYAFNTIFRQGLGIIVGSLTAFLLGQLIDVFVFQKLRAVTGPKMIWLRATGSTLVSQFIDSFVVLGIAFYVFGNWSLPQIAAVGLINYVYKFTVALALTPVLYAAHGLIDRYLGKELAEKMTEEATEDRAFL